MKPIAIREKDYELAKFLKALGNPVRLSIIRKLMEKGSCPYGCNPCSCGDNCSYKDCQCGCKCGEFVDMFSVSQSTVSQHLKELKNAGVIDNTSRKGDYKLDHHRISQGLQLLLALLDHGGEGTEIQRVNSNESSNLEKMNRKYKPN